MRRPLLLLPLLAGMASAAEPDPLPADAAALAGSVLVHGRAYDVLRELCDRHGPRLTGSPTYDGAVAWALEQLRAAGLAEVRREELSIPSRWERGPASARMVAPLERELHVMPVPWSPPTPPAGLRAPVVVVTELPPRRVGVEELRGKIVVVDMVRVLDSLRIEDIFARLAASYDLFERAGVVAVVWSGTRANQVMKPSGSKYWDAQAGKWPAVDLGLEDFRLVERLARKGPVELTLHVATRVGGPARVANVLGEVRGREHPEEVVLVGAHLDAWDLATGAQDNGSGVAQVIEAARAVAAMGRAPRRTIRFALWAGEEQGCLGSRAHAQALARAPGELDRVVALLNSDSGAGSPRGWEVEARPDVRDALEPIATRLLAGLGPEISLNFTCDTDHASFLVWGVPTLNLLVDDSRYDEIHHLPADTLDKVAPAPLAAGAALVAVTAWAIAEQPERLAPRLPLKEVDRLLAEEKETGCAGLRK